MIAKRAKSRGLTIEQYMAGNLLKEEVKASDVADAFYHLSISYRTRQQVL
ncbi:MAG: hypothetical protein CM15mP70_12550 [Pelagibacteraceae bacterium]|nr:MAG: hypothetical protein CM15mP70_12550 [Pelagibacteraceae bacterium]